jgi:hypothetical protein
MDERSAGAGLSPGTGNRGLVDFDEMATNFISHIIHSLYPLH